MNVKNFYTTKINNPLTNKPYERGDKIKDDELFFSWVPYQNNASNGWIMYTLSEEKFVEQIKQNKIRLSKNLLTTKQSRHKRRINPKTNKYFVRGDREGDKYFLEYRLYSTKRDQLSEKWCDLETLIFNIKKAKFISIKSSAKKKNIPFELTFDDYLLLFIKNGECFLSKNPHDFIGETKCSRFYISRISKSLGYIKGNLEVTIYKD